MFHCYNQNMPTFPLFVKHRVLRPRYNLNTAKHLKNICCSAIKLYGVSDWKASTSAYRIVSSSCYTRISIWPFYVNLMRKDSCIYARVGVYSPNILIREGWIKYLLGGIRVRKGGLSCVVMRTWGGRRGKGRRRLAFLYECLSLPQGATILRRLAVVRVWGG